jgi:hypothetical protein
VKVSQKPEWSLIDDSPVPLVLGNVVDRLALDDHSYALTAMPADGFGTVRASRSRRFVPRPWSRIGMAWVTVDPAQVRLMELTDDEIKPLAILWQAWPPVAEEARV